MLVEKPFNKSDILNTSIVLYGKSNTGKSTIIQHIMYLIKDDCPNCIIISPSEKTNHTFTDKDPDIDYGSNVPNATIWYTLDALKLKNAVDRNNALSANCSPCNELKYLRKIFNDNAPSNLKQKISKIDSYSEVSRGEKNKAKMQIYKRFISKNRKSLLAQIDKKSILHKAVYYINTNPNILIVIDDNTEGLKDFCKQKVFTEIVTKARHYNITFIMCCHQETVLTPQNRTAFLTTILCEQQVADNFLKRESNGCPRQKYKEIQGTIPEIYRSGKHKKIVWGKEDMYIVKADIHEAFDFCSPAVWEFCQRTKKDNECDVIDSNNKWTTIFN